MILANLAGNLKAKHFACVVAVLSFLLNQSLLPSFAQSAGDASTANAQSAATAMAPLNLDLSSTDQNLSAPQRLGAGTVVIQVNNTPVTVTAESKLTPAERLAVWQVLSSGQQSIQLGQLGNAVGGTLAIGAHVSQNISTLVIPQGVTLTNTAAALGVSGNLNNLGSLNVLPTAGITAATISAASIFNGAGASIMSSVPLTITAVQDIINNGQIQSLANLTMNAGGGIINQSVAGSTQALISAQTLNLITGSGNIVNSGVLAAISAINVSTQSTLQNLAINNTSGILQVANGNINIGDALSTAKTNLSIIGGDFLSQQLNTHSGTGIVNLDVGNINGQLNIRAGEAHVISATPELILGDINLSGDPSFWNSAGNVQITGNLTFAGQALALVASGNITTNGGTYTISTANGGGSGGSILMIAGANITGVGTGPASVTPVTTAGGGNTTATLTLQGGTAAGGSINLAAATDLGGLTSASTGGGGNGGAITLIAYGGSGASSGQINLGGGGANWTLNAGGNGAGTNGDITLIGGATTGNAIDLIGARTTSISNNTGATQGDVTLVAAAPTYSSGTTMTIVNGSITSGNTFVAGAATAGGISASAITADVDISVTALGAIGTAALTAGGNVTVTSTSAITTGAIIAGGTGNTITLNSGATTLTTGAITNNSATGNAGNITITSGNFVASSDVSARASAGNGSGGIIDITSSGNIFITAAQFAINASGFGTGAGGTVDVAANNLSLNGGAGVVTVQGVANSHLSINANGGTSGAGGNIQVVTNSATLFSLATGAATANGNNATQYAFGASADNGNAAGVANNGGNITVVANGTGGIYYNTVYAIPPSAIQAYGSGTGSGGNVGIYATAGYVRLGGNLSLLRNLAIVAATDIWTDSAPAGTGFQLNLASTTTAGGNMILLAGAQSTFSAATGVLTITGATTTGGGVRFGATTDVSVINSSTTAVNQSGGDVTIAAFAATGAGGLNNGQIHLGGGTAGNWVLTSGGNGTGSNGDVTIIGGGGGTAGSDRINFAVSMTGLNNTTLTTVNTSGGTGGGGNITLASATPTITGAATMTIANGAVSNGTTITAGTLRAFTVQANALTAANNTTFSAPQPTLTLVPTPTLTAPNLSAVVLPAGTAQINVSASLAAGGTVQVNGAITNSASGGNFTGGIINISGNSVATTAAPLALTTNGAGTGNGGFITLTSAAATSNLAINSAAAAGNIRLSAIAGVTGSGNGGILMVNAGRNITVTTGDTSLNAAPQAATNGDGGQVYLTSTAGNGGTVTVNTNMIVTATGVGTGDGGVMSFVGDILAVNGRTLTANAGTLGIGGTINLKTTSNNALTLGGAGVAGMNARGGSSVAGTANHGGTILVQSGAALTANIGSFNVTPTAGTGNGGSIIFSAATAAAGALSIAGGSLTANGLAAAGNSANGGNIVIYHSGAFTGNTQLTAGNISAVGAGVAGTGGTVAITYNDGTNLFTIGSAVVNSGIFQGITVDGAGTGAGGSVTLIDTANAPSGMRISLTSAGANGTISANGNAGAALGFIYLNVTAVSGAAVTASQPISVTGSAVGNGTLTGQIVANGTTVTLNPQSAANTLTIDQIVASSTVTITNTNGASSVSITNNLPGISISAGGAININTPTLTNNGIVQTSTGLITLQNSSSGTFTLGGTTGSIINNAAGLGISIITNQAAAAAGTLALNGTQTFTVTAGNAVTLTNNAANNAFNVTMGAASAYTITGGTININSAGSGVMTVTGPAAAATSLVATNGINITQSANAALTFAGANTTFNFNGPFVSTVSTAGAATNISNTVTVASNDTLTFNVNVATFTNSGTISSSMTDGSITIQSPGALTIAGTGVMTASTGTAPYVWINGNSGGGAGVNTLTITGSQTFNIGTGATFITAFGTNTTLSLGAASTTTINGTFSSAFTGGVYAPYPYLNLSAPTITLGAGATVAATGGAFISIDSGCVTCHLTLQAPTGSSATFSTQNNMPIYVAVQADPFNITYSQSGVGVATLNMNGWFFSYNRCGACTQTINSGVTIATNNYAQFQVEAGGTFTNNGTVSNSNGSGTIAISGTAGTLNVNGTGTLSSPTISFSTSAAFGIAATMGTITGTVNIAAAPTTVTLATTASGLTVGGTVNATAGDINFTAATGVLTVKTGSTLFANEGNVRLVNSNAAAGSIIIGDIVGSATPTLVEGYTVTGNTALGNVDIYIGVKVQVAGVQPANVTLTTAGGGIVYWGANSITAAAPVNQVKALNRTVTFSTGGLAATAIRLNGSTSIIADPPVVDPLIITAAPPTAAEVQAALADPSLPAPWALPPATAAGTTPANVTTALPVAQISHPEALVNAIALNLPSTQIVHSATTPLDLIGGIEVIDNDVENENKRNRREKTVNLIVDISDASSDESGQPTRLKSATFDGARVRYLGNLNIALNQSGMFTLNSGEALLTTHTPTVLEISNQKVMIARGTTILIEKRGNISVLRNIHDSTKNAVKILFDKQSVSVAVGEEAVITQSDIPFSSAVKNDGIGRRASQSATLPNGQTVTRSEISLISLLEHNPILLTIFRSSSKQDQALANKVKKITACLMVATTKHGAYSGNQSEH